MGNSTCQKQRPANCTGSSGGIKRTEKPHQTSDQPTDPGSLTANQQQWEDIEKPVMTATTLTPKGWSGASFGTWSNKPNVVINETKGIKTSGSKLINSLGKDDIIIGTSKVKTGVRVLRESRRGNLQLGDGDDQITGQSNKNYGIDNQGFIYTGNGNDSITGSGLKRGLRNRGFIFTQAGDDQVDARTGGISGKKNNFIDLGSGRDKFLGFGEHLIYGGAGKDLLLLPKGSYTIDRQNSRRTRIEKGKDRLELVDFEQIGSIDGGRNDRISIDKDGTLVVKANGDITFS